LYLIRSGLKWCWLLVHGQEKSGVGKVTRVGWTVGFLVSMGTCGLVERTRFGWGEIPRLRSGWPFGSDFSATVEMTGGVVEMTGGVVEMNCVLRSKWRAIQGRLWPRTDPSATLGMTLRVRFLRYGRNDGVRLGFENF